MIHFPMTPPPCQLAIFVMHDVNLSCEVARLPVVAIQEPFTPFFTVLFHTRVSHVQQAGIHKLHV